MFDRDTSTETTTRPIGPHPTTPLQRGGHPLHALLPDQDPSTDHAACLSLVEAVRELAGDPASNAEELLALLWLFQTSEHVRRTLCDAPPRRAVIESLCDRFGDPARAWIQFSSGACDLLLEEPDAEAGAEPTPGMGTARGVEPE